MRGLSSRAKPFIAQITLPVVHAEYGFIEFLVRQFQPGGRLLRRHVMGFGALPLADEMLSVRVGMHEFYLNPNRTIVEIVPSHLSGKKNEGLFLRDSSSFTSLIFSRLEQAPD